MPLNIFCKVKKSAYVTLIQYSSLKISKKLITCGVLKPDYELKIQKQHSHLRFM